VSVCIYQVFFGTHTSNASLTSTLSSFVGGRTWDYAYGHWVECDTRQVCVCVCACVSTVFECVLAMDCSRVCPCPCPWVGGVREV